MINMIKSFLAYDAIYVVTDTHKKNILIILAPILYSCRIWMLAAQVIKSWEMQERASVQPQFNPFPVMLSVWTVYNLDNSTV